MPPVFSRNISSTIMYIHVQTLSCVFLVPQDSHPHPPHSPPHSLLCRIANTPHSLPLQIFPLTKHKMSFECHAYGAKDASVSSVVEKLVIKRRNPGPNDVHIELRAATICHSDCHTIRGEWGPLQHPVNAVVGHEGVGVIVAVGENVSKDKVGTWVGVGCMVGANCAEENGERTCTSCVKHKDERFCTKGPNFTYNSPDIVDGEETGTKGCYSTDIVINQHFAVPLPDYFTKTENLNFAPAIMCAGTTLYTALVTGKCGPGKKVAINGIGGLGMYGISIAKALGAEVYALTRTESKRADLLAVGCTDVIITTDAEQVKSFNGKLDLIIDTVSAVHDTDALLSLLVPYGALGIVGAPPTLTCAPFSLVARQTSIYGSMIGSIEHSREVLELCAKHEIKVPVELIHPKDIETSYARMLNSDVHYRFAIDLEAMRRGE